MPQYADRLLSPLIGADGDPVRNLDLSAQRKEFFFVLPQPLRRCVVSLLDNPQKDEPLLWTLLNCALLVPPAACALVLYAPSSHLAGAVYFASVYGLFLQRFALALHYSQHRRVFAGAWNVLPVLLCPFFGLPLGVYRLHHCAMHHTESNGWDGDISSTERYQRDRALHCARYICRFLLFTALELPLYALRTGRYAQAVAVIAGMVAHVTTASVVATRAGAPCAVWMFAVPFVVTQCALAFGNWSQHVFINPDLCRDAYGMAYTCINHDDNARTFNDGYHATHHAHSRLHWSEMPAYFMANAHVSAEKDALVFQRCHFFDVGAAVLTGRLGWLADRHVRLPGQAVRTKHELVAELRRRLQPIVVVL
jgi:hypothetical protein